jgi:DNA repair exonuclease SbcCD nuclease subunit
MRGGENMKRAKKAFKRADGILMSDPHLRLSVPECRDEEEFLKAQWRKMEFISELQKAHDCPVLCGGDLFNHWKPSPELLTETMLHLPANFHTIYGQHDLPQHSLPDQNKSGVFALKTAGALNLLPGCHWGQDPTEIKQGSFSIKCGPYDTDYRSILVWHKMNYQGKLPWPGCTDPRAGKLLRKYPTYDLILTGDNHKPFTEEYENRILVNPGSLMRQSADQIDFKPRVYLYYAVDNRVEIVYLPIENDVVDRTHLETVSERSDRIDAFIKKLDGKWKAGLSYEANLEEYLKANRVRNKTKQICYKAIES